ncbi:MAG: hybrid sensor histidine kinase/response regulator, partial [Candidatus Dormibacteraceae bacterium]
RAGTASPGGRAAAATFADGLPRVAAGGHGGPEPVGPHVPAGIIVVDDDASKLRAIESILDPLHQEVTLAPSGAAALRFLLRREFAVILLDVRMAGMDGFETASLIRQRRNSERTPIIFVTAFDKAEIDMARGYSLGAVDYIFSPIVPEILRAKVSVFVDLHQKTEAIRQLLVEAQEASRAKSDFLNMAAHELRTPLSVVSGYISMLLDGSLGSPPESWRHPLGILNDKAGELNKLVDDLLLAARMEIGGISGTLRTLDLRDEVRAAMERAEPRANLVEADSSCRLPRYPVLIEADPDHLGRILDNLVNNAFTYSIGPPWVRVTVSGQERPKVVVEDHGVGIPSSMRNRVFERFFRINDAVLGPQPGTGLGLYISRELAQRYGGSLDLSRTDVGKGSSFVLRIPPATATSLPRVVTRREEDQAAVAN